jgi:hypothetical protein
MASRAHMPLKILSFNANGILKRRHDLSKQLEDLHTGVAVFRDTSETSLEMFS